MIVFKDAEKHDPKEVGQYLCIVQYVDYEPFFSDIQWSGDGWVTQPGCKILGFSKTRPETALKGISEDPEETVYK